MHVVFLGTVPLPLPPMVDLKVSGQCQGGLQLFSGLFSKDDIHSWTGAHDLKVSGQFQGGLQLFSGLFFKR